MSRCRNWCLTLNNYTLEEKSELLSKLNEGVQASTIQYYVIGMEVGAAGTPHLQGYVQFCSTKRLPTVKNILNNQRMHLESQSKHSTAMQAAVYCKKDGDFVEEGTLKEKCQRTDLMKIKEKIDQGITYAELWDQEFKTMVQYRKAFGEYIALKRSSIAREMPIVLIFFGTTGTGKTRRAFEINPNSTWVYPGKGWFDGYCGQEVAVFDEFDGSDLEFSLWKRLCDRYQMQVPVKGGYVPWYPKVIVFTSNVNPDNWWLVGVDKVNLPNGHAEQRDRRVSARIRMDEPYAPGNPWIGIENLRNDI